MLSFYLQNSFQFFWGTFSASFVITDLKGAVERDDAEELRALIEGGVDLNHRFGYETLLDVAWGVDLKVASKCMAVVFAGWPHNGLCIYNFSDRWGPLHTCCHYFQGELFRRLLTRCLSVCCFLLHIPSVVCD